MRVANPIVKERPMSAVANQPSSSNSALLEGRVAVVTGAASGIGAAIARRFAAEGASVALLARREDRLRELAEQLRSTGASALAVPTDVADPTRLADAAARIESELGTVDVLVNNAGVMLPGAIDEQPIAEWERMIDTNLWGALRAIRAFIPALLAAGETRGIADLVNISSMGSKLVFPTYSVYGATKAALTQLSADLRAELGPRNVRVTDLQPGPTRSELADNVTDPQARDGLAAMFDAITPLSGEDIADLVSYLVSRPAHVNVATLDIVPTRQV
jgi:NADP-dependent 3-hydroxy acid dehydrogenase YdfG